MLATITIYVANVTFLLKQQGDIVQAEDKYIFSNISCFLPPLSDRLAHRLVTNLTSIDEIISNL